MDIKYYNDYLKFKSQGLKKQATDSIREFIQSFATQQEIEEWVWTYLSALDVEQHSHIRYEIFHDLIYPVLEQGYLANDFQSTLWMGKLIGSVDRITTLGKRLDWIGARALFGKCYAHKPENNEVRLLLLKTIVSWLEFCQHEWPSGILYGMNGATLEQCQEIEHEVIFAKSLDREHRYAEFFVQFTEKLLEYKARKTQLNVTRGLPLYECVFGRGIATGK